MTSAPNPARMQWLGEDVPVTPCDIASAATGADGIALAFGRREAADANGVPGAVRGQLLHQVQLQPEAAAGLRQMLARLLEAEAKQQDMAAGMPSSSPGGAPAAANFNPTTRR